MMPAAAMTAAMTTAAMTAAAMTVAAPSVAMVAPMIVVIVVATIISAGIIDASSPYPTTVGIRAIEPDAVIKPWSIPPRITIVIILIVLVGNHSGLHHGGKRRL